MKIRCIEQAEGVADAAVEGAVEGVANASPKRGARLRASAVQAADQPRNECAISQLALAIPGCKEPGAIPGRKEPGAHLVQQGKSWAQHVPSGWRGDGDTGGPGAAKGVGSPDSRRSRARHSRLAMAAAKRIASARDKTSISSRVCHHLRELLRKDDQDAPQTAAEVARAPAVPLPSPRGARPGVADASRRQRQPGKQEQPAQYDGIVQPFDTNTPRQQQLW